MIFSDFFYHLRAQKIPCSTTEYMDFLKTVQELQKDKPLSLDQFYSIARNCLVKDIKHYDAYDVVFARVFKDVISDEDFKLKLLDWLNKAVENEHSEERKRKALRIPPKDLIKELEKRFKEQKERHDGGNKWVGTGGTSPFGNSGFNPEGIRIGGQGKSRSAIAVAGERIFKDYRTDETLDLRKIKMALKKLRELKKKGREELSLSKSIKKTCDNGGEIELVFEKKRKNNLKVLLIMDVGGSMDPHARNVSKLFSSAHQIQHFKEFKSFYFHNIFYDHLYLGGNLREKIKPESLFNKYDKETRVIFVGDACMAPYELFDMTGSIRDYYWSFNERNSGSSMTGYDRILQWKKHFPKTIWLNPEPIRFWKHPTITAVKDQIEMFSLTIDGIEAAIKTLKK